MSKKTVVSQIFAQIKAARKDNEHWNDSMLVDWLLESEEGFMKSEMEQIVEAVDTPKYRQQNYGPPELGRGIGWFVSGKEYYQQKYGE
jgi:hypothetical protein